MKYAAYTQKVLGRFSSGVDCYRRMIGQHAPNAQCVVHLGCGRDLNDVASLFSCNVRVLGIDPDFQAIRLYPGLALQADAAAMPLRDDVVDLVCCEYVLEHLSDCLRVFGEVERVLRPGGVFVSVAPNFWSYKSLIAWITPHWFHRYAVRTLRSDGKRYAADVYRTVFEANSQRALARLARESGLTIEQLVYVDNGPTWFQRLPGVFEVGRLFHALLRFRFLAFLRCNIIAVLGKPAGSKEAS